MKRSYKITAVLALMAATLFSCEKPDFSEGRNDQVDGLMNVTLKIPGNPVEYTAVKKGPYEEGEEILVKLPTSDDAPLDVTKIYCTVSVEHNCFVNPPVGKILDFTEPYPIEVTDALGNVHHNTIRVLPVPPKTRFENVWTKTDLEMGIPSRSNMGMAMNDKYMAVLEWGAGIGPNFHLFDYKTGTRVKTINTPNIYMFRVRTDDAGHFVVATCNEKGSNIGFNVYVYDDETESFKVLLNYLPEHGCPLQLGLGMSVVGDVTKGKSYVYATGADGMNIYWWELKDGLQITHPDKPNVMRYGPAKTNWYQSQVQRMSIEDDSDMYISYLHMGGNDKEGGSAFQLFTPEMDITTMNQLNHMYKILDFKVFTLDDDIFLVTNQQGFISWDYNKLRVYEITDKHMMELVPEDEGYKDFMVFDEVGWGIVNYNKIGNVDVEVEETPTGYDVWIGLNSFGFEASTSMQKMYKMTYYRQ